MALSNRGRALVFAGGVPLIDVDGTIVGVSGGSREQDTTVAEPAAAGLHAADA